MVGDVGLLFNELTAEEQDAFSARVREHGLRMGWSSPDGTLLVDPVTLVPLRDGQRSQCDGA